jgi:hypothetical protein
VPHPLKNGDIIYGWPPLDADTGLITTPFDDVGDLPNEVKDTLLKGLKSKNLLGDALAR